MASPTLPQAIKKQISSCVTLHVPGDTHNILITPLQGRVFVSGKAVTRHWYLVSQFDIITLLVSQ